MGEATAYVVYDRRTGRRLISLDGEWEIHQRPHPAIIHNPIFRYHIITWGEPDERE